MTTKSIEKLLEQTLMNDGEMQYDLYRYELEDHLDEWKSSMVKDNDDYIFAVTNNGRYTAMVLIEKSEQVHINERARERLKTLWPTAYGSNMQKLIPKFAEQLNEGEIPMIGVKMVAAS